MLSHPWPLATTCQPLQLVSPSVVLEQFHGSILKPFAIRATLSIEIITCVQPISITTAKKSSAI
jgi:hypothetical protein